MKEGEPKETPEIISDLNASFKPYEITVETLAEKIGISKTVLYKWVKTGSEFSEALERFKILQEEDPFNTGTEEDTYVNSIMIALLLFETRDRPYKSGNI